MKETIHANIGSVAFSLDRDAYQLLKSYLDDIRDRLPEDDTETIGDIECRIAEIFRERIPSPMLVVSIDTVREAMNRMGRPEEFGQRRNAATEADDDTQPAPRRLRRSRTDRSIAGICGGIGEFFRIDSTAVRLVTLLLILFGGLSIWAYVILWIVVPEAPATRFDPYTKKR